MRILLVKLSSLGDVVHAMAALQDIHSALPKAQVDWVVERGFAPLLARCAGLENIIACELRRWRRSPLAADTRAQWRAFKAELQQQAYDAVIDLQGLTKSAVVARLARLAPGGRRYAMANQTEGSSYEAPTRWLADDAIAIEPHVHAVQRSRLLCARALAYSLASQEQFGLQARASDPQLWPAGAAPSRSDVVLAHGSSREDKLWPDAHWIALGQRLQAAGLRPVLPHGSQAEQARSERLARQLPGAVVWPRLPLDALTDALGATAGVIGVDSGLSHIAVALNLAHVQIYNFDTAWRTGPVDRQRQRSVYAQPTPTLEQVWQAWLQVSHP
jgi:heptosyltransferase-1